jgi:hypothetical protein
MDPMAKTFRFVLAVSLGVLCAYTAAASTITVENFSFETPPLNGFNNSCGAAGSGCVFSTGRQIPGWLRNGGGGELQPGNSTIFNTLTNGRTVAFSTGGGTLVQTVSSTVQLDFTYTLMVDLGERNDLVPAFTAGANLKIGNRQFGAAGIAPAIGGWSTFQATYVGLAADVGKTITIQLTSGVSSGSEADFDNVRLSAVAPEPAGVTLLGLGLAGLLVFAGRKRAS